MKWEELRFKKAEVKRAGTILRDEKKYSEDEINKATEVFNNWRAIHNYPLHIFQMTLKNVSRKYDKNALVAQRLKRESSILFKLRRPYNNRRPSMELNQMQDIAGCRAILKNVKIAREIYENYYLRGNLRHKKCGNKDYVTYPKKDGYRGFHLIYEFKSDKGKSQYNGLKVEIQIRSKLQHLWATAVETVDFFTRQAIKFNEGVPDWTEFFRLVSSAFAIKEKTPTVEVIENKAKLYERIKEMEKSLEVIKKLNGWTNAMKFFNEEVKKTMRDKATYFLLELDLVGERLSIMPFTKKQEEEALIEYSELERRYKGNPNFDVVLVGAETTKDLEKAYPNYFADTKAFIEELEEILAKVK